MPFLDGKPVIITKRNTDKHGNPISVKQIETKQVVDIHNSIPLNYSIDRNHPIVISGMHQIYNKDEISENTFYVDYDQGILYFHPRLVGKSITITYMGTGYILISSDRIYRYNKGDGTSATESIEASLEKLENILNTIIKNGGGCDQIVAEVIGSRTDAQGQTFPSLGDRLNYITTQLDNLTTIVRYKRLLKVDTDITTVTVGIAEYNPKSDALSVYLSGVRMIEGEDYSLDENNRAITCLKGQWNIGDELYFEVLQRSTDSTPPGGGGSLPTSIESSNVVLNNPMFGANNAQDAFIQIDILLKDKVDKKDFNDLTNNFNLLNQEVIDARTDKNGVVNNNLKERLDKVDSRIERIYIDISEHYNGNWDDTFKNCLELINNNGGGKLYIPNIEDINITETIKIYSNTEIYSNGAIINFSGVSRLFENVNRTTSEKDKNITLKGIVCVNKNRLTDNSRQHGVSFHNTENVIIENCSFYDFSGDGIYIGANGYGCKNVTIKNNIVNNWGRMGIAVTDCDKCVIDGNTLTQLKSWIQNSAIDIEPNTENDVINNIVIMNNTCTMGCINLYSKANVPIQQNRIVIKNNKLLNADLVAINVTRFSNVDIIGNYLNGSQKDSIVCYLTSNSNIISNVIENCLGDNGIKVSTSEIANIEGNIIRNIKKYSINAVVFDKATIRNNNIEGYNIGIQFNTNVKYSTILGNILTNPIAGAIAIYIYDNNTDGGCIYNNISSNIINDSNNRQSYGIRSANNSDYNIVVNNNINYGSKGKILLVGNNNININNL